MFIIHKVDYFNNILLNYVSIYFTYANIAKYIKKNRLNHLL